MASAFEVATSAAEAADGVPGVVDRDAGTLNAYSTYGDGRRCGGVTVRSGPDGVVVGVRVIAAFGSMLPDLAAGIRAAVTDAVAPSLDGRALTVDVHITDLAPSPT